jgi:diaminopimelate decarboxylase
MEKWSEQLDFNAIGEQYGTPLYLFSTGQLRSNFASYVRLVRQPRNIAYPVKANPSFEVLRQLHRLGGSVDCASASEVRLAQLSGFTPDRIFFNSPAATVDEVLRLLAEGMTVVVDSREMMEPLYEALADRPLPGSMLLRVSPTIPLEYAHAEDWQAVTAHGSAGSKFGIPAEEVVDLLSRYPLPVRGLHIHIGTQMDNTDNFVRIIGYLHELKAEIEARTMTRLDTLNLGGGLGIDFTGGDEYPTLDRFREALAAHLLPDVRYMVEPGHSLIGNTMGILTRVTAKKRMRDKSWGIVDVGSDQLIKVTLLKWPHRILTADHQPLPFEGGDALGGPLCFSGDTLLHETSLNDVEAGDHLFIQHCGAYTFSISNHFNGRLYSGMVRVDDDGSLVRCNERQSLMETPMVTTHVWDNDADARAVPEEIPLEAARRLNSNYLQEQARDDRYDISAVRRLAENKYEVTLDARAAVDFVSMPYGIRLAGDATIISIMHRFAKKEKDISIWADHLQLNCPTVIAPNRELKVVVSFSETYSRGPKHQVLARFSLADGAFTGMFRLKFTTEEMVETVTAAETGALQTVAASEPEAVTA